MDLYGKRESADEKTWRPDLARLTEFRQLRTLNLGANDMGSGIPEVIYDLKLLKALDLSFNKLEGLIPACWELLIQVVQHALLAHLSLFNDRFPTNIPSCLGNLNKLNSLSLSSDGFKGNLNPLFIDSGGLEGTLQFSVFSKLSKLEDISIISKGGLEINTEYPISWVPSFWLQNLYIEDCAVNSGRDRLQYLSFSSTSSTGTPPISLFCNSTLSTLNLKWNKFSSSLLLPCHNVSQNVETIDLSFNDMHWPLPKNIGFSFPKLWIDNDNNLSRKLPYTLMHNQSKLLYLNVYLSIKNNYFTGSLLSRFSNSSGLLIIDIGCNSFRDNFSNNLCYFPKCYLPKELYQMQYLRLLDVSRNNLSGNIVPCLHNISFWRSTRPNKGLIWIDSRAQYARVFIISKNLVNPYEGDPLQGMTIFDVSEVGELKGPWSLNLSNNHIQAFIPMTMAYMETIESLDILHKGLSGSVPHEMVQISSLTTFSVAFNNLSGNLGLCGKPVEKACSTKKEGAKKMTDNEENKGNSKDLNDALFYSLVIVSFILGFWGLLASVFFNMSWRRTYFKIIDEYYKIYLSDF
ncbi:unnamed protein product [Spirodela intermedia]|uniref:Uncharacterized protein n=1 Tax=Spirodela intermedia TaxID=51605 RepID=A0A7I8JPL9_SPIIN|nr:unnamed protein product [Spirodela intermedia]CAA6672127.1 unnamed protein product [Spirodela intermedia]